MDSPKAAAPQVLLLLPPCSPDPRSSSRAVAPCVPAAMPSPPSAPAAAAVAAAEEKRPFPLSAPIKKLKRFFLQAVSSVFGGMGRAWGVAMLGINALICVVRVASFTTDPEVSRFWEPIFRVWLYLGVAFILLMVCLEIRDYLAGKSDPPQQHQPAASSTLQLPPPPPEMDMC